MYICSCTKHWKSNDHFEYISSSSSSSLFYLVLCILGLSQSERVVDYWHLFLFCMGVCFCIWGEGKQEGKKSSSRGVDPPATSSLNRDKWKQDAQVILIIRNYILVWSFTRTSLDFDTLRERCFLAVFALITSNILLVFSVWVYYVQDFIGQWSLNSW